MIYFLNAIVARIRAYAIYQQTRTELAQLDDRSLADMGFQRGEIEFLARKAAKTA
ncbi:DUF1127 domain-containing protein [Phreatobacter sp.]|uniref:DUF1127 domain-containing protein n=1 Tax=Phreatobacter sp. TaxID=1966341 RepID=UPI003F6E6B97